MPSRGRGSLPFVKVRSRYLAVRFALRLVLEMSVERAVAKACAYYGEGEEVVRRYVDKVIEAQRGCGGNLKFCLQKYSELVASETG